MAILRHLVIAILALSLTTSVSLPADDIGASRLWGAWETRRSDNGECCCSPERLRIEFSPGGDYRVVMVVEHRGRLETVEVTGSYSLEGVTLLLSTKGESSAPLFNVTLDGWDLVLEFLETKNERRCCLRFRRAL